MNRLINVMHNISQKSLNDLPDLLFGEVTGTDPVSVRVDDKFELSEDFLILGGMVKETWINVPEDDDNEHNHTMEEMLTDMQGMSPAGPVVFAPAGELPAPFMPDPEDPEKEIPNPNFPKTPSTLSLQHYHTIHNALPKIKLWRGLKVGDKVRMFRVGRGQRYYIFEREEGITNDS